MVSLILHSTSTSLLVPLSYSSFFNTCYNHSHIFLCFLSLLATSNSLLPTLLFSTFFYVQLLVHHDITGLSPLLASYSFVYIYIPSFNTKSPSICHLSPHNNLTPTFFIFSTTLIISSSFSIAFFYFFIFSSISTFSPSITTSAKLQIHCSLINVWFSLSFSTLTFQSSLLLSPSTFPIFASSACFKVKSNLNR